MPQVDYDLSTHITDGTPMMGSLVFNALTSRLHHVRPSRLRGTTSSGVPPAPERAPLGAPRAGRARQRVRLLAHARRAPRLPAYPPLACL
jgi:hypothetical protein